MIGYSFLNNKLKCKFGLTTSFISYAQIYKYDSDIYNNWNVIKDKSTDGFTNLLWSGNIEIVYLVYQNIGINFNYNRSFNSVYDDDASIGKPKYNIFSVGLTYNFIK